MLVWAFLAFLVSSLIWLVASHAKFSQNFGEFKRFTLGSLVRVGLFLISMLILALLPKNGIFMEKEKIILGIGSGLLAFLLINAILLSQKAKEGLR